MRKLITLLAVLASLLMLPSLAQAANCSASASNTVHNTQYPAYPWSLIYYQANIFGCSDVEAVQWAYYPPGAAFTTGWYDYAASTYANGKIGATVGNASYGTITLNNPGGGYNNMLIQQTCWYSGTRTLKPGFWWRIKGATSHAWGSYHFTQAGAQPLLC